MVSAGCTFLHSIFSSAVQGYNVAEGLLWKSIQLGVAEWQDSQRNASRLSNKEIVKVFGRGERRAVSSLTDARFGGFMF